MYFRCKACNKKLKESDKEFEDLCEHCYNLGSYEDTHNYIIDEFDSFNGEYDNGYFKTRSLRILQKQ